MVYCNELGLLGFIVVLPLRGRGKHVNVWYFECSCLRVPKHITKFASVGTRERQKEKESEWVTMTDFENINIETARPTSKLVMGFYFIRKCITQHANSSSPGHHLSGLKCSLNPLIIKYMSHIQNVRFHPRWRVINRLFFPTGFYRIHYDVLGSNCKIASGSVISNFQNKVLLPS